MATPKLFGDPFERQEHTSPQPDGPVLMDIRCRFCSFRAVSSDERMIDIAEASHNCDAVRQLKERVFRTADHLVPKFPPARVSQLNMSHHAPRILCSVPISQKVTIYTCTRCTWWFRFEGSDMTAAEAAFKSHRCTEFPRTELHG